jgi:hypothetical protein
VSSDGRAVPDIAKHVVRMRLTAGAFFAAVPLAAALCYVLPRRGAEDVSPLTLTMIAIAAVGWIGFTANADARKRLERIRRAAAVHGDDARLLRDHWLVYIVILVRLEVLVVAGIVVAVWGVGPAIGVWVVVLGGLMIGLTWPTPRKAHLLLGRVRALRDSGRMGSG